MTEWSLGLRLSMLGRAVLLIGLITLAAPAHAELTCSAFTRGAVLQDPDVIAQAKAIDAPLEALGWRSPAMLDEGVQTVPSPDMWSTLLLRQLFRDCQALPGDTVDAIVATHMKAAQAKRAADEAYVASMAKLKAEGDARSQAQDAAVKKAEAIAPPMPKSIPAMEAAVSRITCGQYLKANQGVYNTSSMRAFTVVLQRMVDADPIARRAHIHYAGSRQYEGAFGYCYNHPDGNLGGALQDMLATARSWDRQAGDKAQAERLAAMRANPNRSADDEEELEANKMADAAGPRGSCRWTLAYNGYVDSKHPEQAGFTDMATMRSNAINAWCRKHPSASRDDLSKSGLDQ